MPLSLSYSLADQEFARTKSIGIWNVSRQLPQHLAAHPGIGRLTVFSNRTHADLEWPEQVVRLNYDRARGGRFGRLFWDQWGVYSAARQSGNPWLFLPKGYASFLRRCPVRLAAFVHDAMHDYYRRTCRPNPLGREAVYFLRSLRATVRQADVIFTNSDFTATEVKRLASEWRLAVPRICTAGIGFAVPPPRASESRARVLVLTGALPHKCTRLAMEYLTRWARGRTDLAGVDWVGGFPAGLSLPELPGWQRHLRLAEAEYDRILRCARVVVYFSAYEGFGMPPIEATLAGAAAVYSSIPPMLEVMGPCGFAFANDSYEDFAAAMQQAMAASADQLARWRADLSRRHSWEQVAGRIIRELDAVERSRRP